MEELKSRLAANLGKPPPALQGPLGIGKTSILHQLNRELEDGWFLLLVDLEGESPKAAVEPARLASRVVAAAKDAGIGPSGRRGNSLPEIVASVEGPILLALEGWDSLLSGEEGALREWDRVLRQLAEERPNTAALWTGERPPAVWLDEDPERILRLAGLDREAAEVMIRRPAEGILTYDWEATREIISQTGGQPGQIQILCHDVFESGVRRGRVRLRDVENAVARPSGAAMEYLGRLRQRSTPRERAILDGMAETRGVRRVFLRHELIGTSTDRADRSNNTRLEDGLRGLVDRGILEELGGKAYGPGSEVLGSWIFAENREAGWRERDGLRGARSVGSRVRNMLAPVAAVAAVVTLLASSILGSGTGGVTPPASPTPARSAEALGEPEPVVLQETPPFEIAFMVWDATSETWEIALLTSDGLHRRQLTHNVWDDSWPAWSRDGSLIYFVSEREGNREVYVMEADGSDPQNLTRHPAPDSNPSISPEGTRLAFASRRDGNWEIYQSNADGSQPARMTFHEAFDYSPKWSPDGRQIAFVSDRDGDLEIFVMNADGARILQLTQNEATDTSPSWSPDGRQIAFQSYRDGNMEIYVMNADGSAQRNLTNRPLADDQEPVWSPEGSRIMFSSRSGDVWDLHVVEVASGEVRRVTDSPAIEQAPAWRWGVPT